MTFRRSTPPVVITPRTVAFMAFTAWCAVALSVGGCTDSAPLLSVVPPVDTTPPPKVVAIAVTTDSDYVRAGSETQAYALPLTAAGVPIPGKTASWSVAGNPNVATISSSGYVTTIAPGVAVLVATVDGVQGEGALIVRPPVGPAAVRVSLDSTTLLVGRTTMARAMVIDSVGEVVQVGPPVWSIRGSPAVATVSSSGEVTALAPGEVFVVATVGKLSGEDTLTVVPPANVPVASVTVMLDQATLPITRTTQARFVARDASGGIVPGRVASWTMAPGSVAATVSTLGIVTAVAVGSAQVVATVDGISGGADVTIVDSSTTSNQIRLPDLPIDSVRFSYPAVTGRSIVVRAGGNLQAALNSAQRGDEVVLEAGATFTGSFTLPAKPGTATNGWIVVRSDQQSQLPSIGTRVSPAHAPLMPKLVTPNAAPVVMTAPGANGWWLTGLELTITPAFTSNNNGLVLLGDGSAKQNATTPIPANLVLDRVYVHSQPNVGTSRCVALNSARSMVRDSYLDECHLKGFDSQAIVGWNGPGPFLIENNLLAGAGENIMFGGGDPGVAGLVPSDIIIRRNYIYTPVSWKTRWTKKNLFELKNAQRVLLEENVLDGSWADGQVGFAVLLKSANQGGKCTWCASRDVTIRYNLIRNAAGGFNLTGREGGSPHPVGERLTRLLIEHNILENIRGMDFPGDGKFLQVLQNVSHLTVRHNTMTSSSSDLTQFVFVGSQPAATAMSFTRNIVARGRYGLFSSQHGEGAAALGNVRDPVEFRDVVVIGPQRPNYPLTTSFVPSLGDALTFANIGANESRVRAMAQVVAVP